MEYNTIKKYKLGKNVKHDVNITALYLFYSVFILLLIFFPLFV